jgi:hypothetical protein
MLNASFFCTLYKTAILCCACTFILRCSKVLQAGRPGFDSRQRKFFLVPTPSRQTVGPTVGTGGPGVRRAGRESDHSPTSSAEVKKPGAVPPLSECLYGIEKGKAYRGVSGRSCIVSMVIKRLTAFTLP